MANRNDYGQFTGKSSDTRHVRSLRTTDAVWERINAYADSQGRSVADVFEAWVLTLPCEGGGNDSGTDSFSDGLRARWHALATSQVGKDVYGHPVTLKSLFSGCEMSWDAFLDAVGTVAAVDGSMELIPLRGQNYPVAGRKVAALTYHS